MRRIVNWPSPCCLGTFAALLVLSATGSLHAQEVKWRGEYNAARKEAEEKSKPLLIDFGTEHCFWCKRLDMTTFHDPTVASLLNEKFVPLKVDAEKELQLSQTLHITSYPTIVLAAPDGKILGSIVGFKEPAEFSDILQRALGSLTTPDWMTRDYQEAAKAVSTSDFARAIALSKGILEDGKDRPVQTKARQVLRDIETQASGRLARAKQLNDKGQTAEAMDALTELVKVYAGSQAATEAGQMFTALASKPDVRGQTRGRRARELLTQAKEDYKSQQYLCCLDRCELLAASFGDMPEGNEAAQLSTEIKNNPEWMKVACDNLADRLGLLYLSLAETWLKKGQPQQAVVYLEKVTQTFPGTRQAEAAQIRLSYIKGQTNYQAEAPRP